MEIQQPLIYQKTNTSMKEVWVLEVWLKIKKYYQEIYENLLKNINLIKKCKYKTSKICTSKWGT